MKNQGLKHIIISECIAKGLDFEKDAFQLSSTEKSILSEYAKECKYRRLKNSYFGLGGSFFLHLQKIYKADRLLQNDLKNL
jgi:hypothetical protein